MSVYLVRVQKHDYISRKVVRKCEKFDDRRYVFFFIGPIIKQNKAQINET